MFRACIQNGVRYQYLFHWRSALNCSYWFHPIVLHITLFMVEMRHTGNLTTLNILSSLHSRFFPFDIETIIMKTRGKILMTVKLWVKQALDKTRSCNKMHLHFTVAKVVTYSQQNILKHKLEFFTTSKTDSLLLLQKVRQKISVIKTNTFDDIKKNS